MTRTILPLRSTQPGIQEEGQWDINEQQTFAPDDHHDLPQMMDMVGRLDDLTTASNPFTEVLNPLEFGIEQQVSIDYLQEYDQNGGQGISSGPSSIFPSETHISSRTSNSGASSISDCITNLGGLQCSNLRELKPRIANQNDPVYSAPPNPGYVQSLRKPRGRKRSLSPEGRRHAADVRLVGACVRCRHMKEKCDAEFPCGSCKSKKRRSYAFPCMREWPKDRGAYLMTDITVGHLDEKLFMESLPHKERILTDAHFTISLRQDFEWTLRVPVQEFNPTGLYATAKTVFPIDKEDGTYKVQLSKLMSPPLMPYIATGDYKAYWKNLHTQISTWLSKIDNDSDFGWEHIFFHKNYGRDWPRAVLAMTCKFYHQVMRRACLALKFALHTTVVVHMIRHVFYIVPEDVPEVLSNMRFGKDLDLPDDYVCPEILDRFIKVLLNPIFRSCVHASMQKYQDLYPGRKVTLLTRDRFLAVSLLLLIIAGAKQQTAVERGHLRCEQGVAMDMSEPHQRVVEIEESFVQPIFDLWDYKFNIGLPVIVESERDERLPALRAKQYGLLEKFQSSYSDHKKGLDLLDEDLTFQVDVRSFSATNTTRLLKRFYNHVFHTSGS